MSEFTRLPEYERVVRLDSRTHPPPDFIFVSRNAPMAVNKYCRTMANACGRMLYTVWDAWEECEIGYLIPSRIAADAYKFADMVPQEAWKDASGVQKRTLFGAVDLCQVYFPYMPNHAVRRVAERMLRMRLEVRLATFEEAVVRYALHHWTNYWHRIEASRVEPSDWRQYDRVEKEAFRGVRPRLRGILESWMSRDASTASLTGFWSRHHLLNAGERQEEARPRLTYFAGAETAGNFSFS